MSVADLETALEHDLLADKLRRHLTAPLIAPHFEEHRADYERARLRMITVGREDLARELLAQVRDDGRDFAELALRHSQHPSRADSGLLDGVARRQLPSAVADAVFAARPGGVVGPLATPQGFHLFLVEETFPPRLDEATAELIRRELFERWLGDKLRDVSFTLPPPDAP